MNTWIDFLLALMAAALLWATYRARTLMGPPVAPSAVPAGATWPARVETWQRTLLRQAGFTSPHALKVLWMARLGLMFFVPLLAVGMSAWTGRAAVSPLTLAMLMAAGFFLPDFWLLTVRRSRQYRIRRALSFFLDLAVALLHSGLTVERAIMRAARDGFLDPHPLAEEVLRLGRELDLGRDTALGFLLLAQRTGVPELYAVASAIRMGLRTGAGLENTLERQADLLRHRYREEGLHRISRMSVVTMVPVFLSGVPLYAVIIFFPALLEFFTTWRVINPIR